MKRKIAINNGDIFDTKNNGKLMIVDCDDSQATRVVFIKTGTKVTTTPKNIITGNVKDPYYPRIHGIGFIGVGRFSSKNKEIYRRWMHMLDRCYKESIRHMNPTYHDCTVADVWHNFQNFAEWHEKKLSDRW